MKFIFLIRTKEGATQREYVDAWKKGSALIQASRGARGTKLYRKIGEPTTLIAIAEWSSKSDRDAAMEKLNAAGIEIQEILQKHKQFGETSILGNFEEIQRIESQSGSRSEGSVG